MTTRQFLGELLCPRMLERRGKPLPSRESSGLSGLLWVLPVQTAARSLNTRMSELGGKQTLGLAHCYLGDHPCRHPIRSERDRDDNPIEQEKLLRSDETIHGKNRA